MNGAFMFAADFLRRYEGVIDAVYFPRVYRGYVEGRAHQTPIIADETIPEHPWRKKNTHVILDVVVEQGLAIGAYLDELPPAVSIAALRVVLVQRGKLLFVSPTPGEWIIGKQLPKAGFLTGYGMGPYRDFPHIYEVPK
jgi:hypoxanthine-guanine phosphoribosyltransferase